MELGHGIYCFHKLAILSIYFHISLKIPVNRDKKK